MNKKAKKLRDKILKIFLLIAIIISDLASPISVLADTLSNEVEPEIGSIRLNNEISETGSVTVSEGSLTNGGDVQVTKTVTTLNAAEGKYNVEFKIKGKDRQDVIENKKPLYLVVVFDTSGSMICDSSNNSYAYDNYKDAYNKGDRINDNNRPDYGYGPGHGGQTEYKHVEPESYTSADGTTIWCSNASKDSSYILKTKWENAVSGAVSFSKSLSEIDNTYISVVTYASTATTATDFAHKALTSSEFGHPVGATNLKEGIENAQNKLKSVTDKDAQKYILVIGDGEPTQGGNNPTEAAKTAATNAKKAGTKIFSIGYGITAGSDAEKVLKAISSNTDTDTSYYQLASVDGLTSSLKTVFKGLGDPKKAGTNATLTDNLGSKFSVTEVSSDNAVADKVKVVSDVLKEITETGDTILSFDIQIDPDSETGWHKTNNGFSVTYTDSNGNTQTITSTNDPEVYWVQKKYSYTVNYYKDEITNKNDGNYLGSKSYEEVKDTVITSSDVDKTFFIPVGYEFNKIEFGNNNETSITITNNNSHNEINVLYTIKKFNYKVNYYYDDVLDSSKTISNIPYNTLINASTHYLSASDIKEGYTLDTTKSDNKSYNITDNDTIINIYYKKNDYGYRVEYYFNNIYDNTFTINSSAVYGSKIYATNYNLSQDTLDSNGKGDYFLNPDKSYDPEDITIGVDEDDNVIKVYYVNTYLKENSESITKNVSTTNSQITSSNQVVNYSVNYKATIKNVNQNDVVTITITDTLPYKIASSSNLTYKGITGVYNEEDNTITWTITKTIDKYYEEYSIDETINYSVTYLDFEKVSSQEDNTLVNTVHGLTRVNDNTLSNGKEDSAEVEVMVKGNLIVKYLEKNTNKVLSTEKKTTEKVGTSYSVSSINIFGYTKESVSGAESGEYAVNDTIVIYYYTKNDGTITNPEVKKEGLDKIDSIDGVFKYEISASAKVEDYVGKATLKVVDTLPYKIDTNNSNFDKNICSYDGNYTITCTKEYTVEESDYVNGVYNISETFKLDLVFIGVDSDIVVNKASSTVKLEKIEKTTDTETDTEVKTGTLKVVYKSTDGTILKEIPQNEELAGTSYTTEKLSFYGYTFKEVTGDKVSGVYVADKDLVVNYIYTKNVGDVIQNEVKKVQNNQIIDIDSEYDYVLSYSGKIENYVGDVTLELTDTLPYNAIITAMDNKCSITGKVITCKDIYEIDKDNNVINASFEIKLKYTNVGAEVKNVVKSKLTYGTKDIESSAEVVNNVPSGTLKVVYKSTNGTILKEIPQNEELAGTSYTTEKLSFYGYTFKEVTGDSANGKYIANKDLVVNYIYTKNIGGSNENLTKEGFYEVDSVNSEFKYVISYKATIEDYVGKATIVIVDELPYKLDLTKSNFDKNLWKYDEENLTLTYTEEYNITEDTTIDINEKFNLYYIGIDSEEVYNGVKSNLTYGSVVKTSENGTYTKVNNGNVIVKYVTIKDNKYVNLTDDITLSGLVGTNYETNEKTFDNYTLTDVLGEVNGEFTALDKEVVYIYELKKIPPKTGVMVDNNNTNILALLLVSFLGLIIKRMK